MGLVAMGGSNGFGSNGRISGQKKYVGAPSARPGN